MNARQFRLILGLFAVLSMAACSIRTGETINTQPSVSTGVGMVLATKTPSEPTPTLTVAPTFTITSIPTPVAPTKTPSVREKWILAHDQERIQLINEQGVAQTIPALEYHGDNYFFSYDNGAVVELGPEGFRAQMKWFHDNSVHAVTGEELVEWLHGEIELPSKSVLLTFDLSSRSKESVSRMLAVFEEFNMHGIFTIMVVKTDARETIECPNDSCWQAFRDAYNSGMATIGSHTITHRDFANVSPEDGLAELAESKRIIEENIPGCVLNILTWPFESVPSWGSRIQEIGFEAAFGGNTYPILKNAAQLAKPEDWYRLPRVLPPNSTGISGRPNNKTLKEIMEMYWNMTK